MTKKYSVVLLLAEAHGLRGNIVKTERERAVMGINRTYVIDKARIVIC